MTSMHTSLEQITTDLINDATYVAAASNQTPRKENTVDLAGKKENRDEDRRMPILSDISEEMKNKMLGNMDQILSEVKKEYEEMSSNDMVECGLWDFAGEKEYYVTHQTFLTQNAIYLIVADLTEDIVTRKMEKDLNYKGIGGNICKKKLPPTP